jgi:hypothetical protein
MSAHDSKDCIDPNSVKFALPLFEALLDLERNIRELFPEKWIPFGIKFDRPKNFKNGGYYCTPTNTLQFASTGVDGEHFSFLVQDHVINAASPIILTTPCNYDGETNVILAKNFCTFLRLGIRHDFFALAELAYHPEDAVSVYTTVDWEPTGEKDLSIYLPDEEQQAILASLADLFDLEPYTYTVDEFTTLQKLFRPLLRMSAEYDEMRED